MKKGQASVEYIMTYGWALLAVVIVIGLLLTSGVFSIDYGFDEECNFGSKFPCASTIYDGGSSTNIALSISNSFPYAVNISNLTLFYEDQLVVFRSPSGNSFLIESGSNQTFTGNLPSLEAIKTKVKIVGNFSYSSCASEISQDSCAGIPHVVSGRIISKVIEG